MRNGYEYSRRVGPSNAGRGSFSIWNGFDHRPPLRTMASLRRSPGELLKTAISEPSSRRAAATAESRCSSPVEASADQRTPASAVVAVFTEPFARADQRKNAMASRADVGTTHGWMKGL